MKWRLWIVLVLALGCDNATAESITEATVERTVEVGRGIGSGITKGARSGRENTESADGATVVGNFEQLEEHGTVEIASVRDEGTDCVVTLRFGNDSDAPLRVTGLSEDGALLAIDNEDVAHQDRGGGATFTVFARARHDAEVRFPVGSALLTGVRVWGHDLPMPAAAGTGTPTAG